MLNHPGGKPASDAWQGIEGCRIGQIQIDKRNVYVRLQPQVYAVRHNIRLRKVGRAAETPALPTVVVDRLGLLLRKTQTA